MAAISTRVARIAEATLAEQRFVTAVDVLIGLGWLTPPHIDRWKQRRVSPLSRCIQVDASKTSAALDALRKWAREHGLQSWDTDYGDLRFTDDDDAEPEFRVRWAAADQPAPEPPAPPKPRELVAVAPLRAWTCATCNGTGDLLVKTDAGAVCLDCADLGHLVLLPSGDAALTRRARKASRLSAVVVRWSRSRKRYERQGILVEDDAIEQALRQCRDDAAARARRRDRDQARSAVIDDEFRRAFAAAITHRFPGCPPERADAIACHAALRGSGRIGRSAAGRALDPDAVRVAVAVSVRHLDTDYDDLLMAGVDRDAARHRVRHRVAEILDVWRAGATVLDG